MAREFVKGVTFSFRATLELPIAATDEQVLEWIEYNTGARCDIKNGNPLMAFDLNAASVFSVVPA